MLAPSFSAVIGRRLHELRLAAGISAARLARKAGLTASALHDIESGRALPSVGALGDLAIELGVSAAELVREARRAEPESARSESFVRTSPEQVGKAIVALPDGGDKLEMADAAAVKYALQVTHGNKAAAARLLGIERKALERRARKHRTRVRS
jgi:transcriptional regulator with XRE-family HTH domain